MKLDIGQTVDRYTIERVLGAGGTAMVYLIRDDSDGNLYALKVLTLTGQSIRERMEREGDVQASMHHPNVVSVYEKIDVDGSLGLVMEFVDGPSLETALGRYRLTLGDAETLFAGILSGVRAAHAQSLVHRDLKPANVLLARTADGFVPKVTDFGLAKVLEQAPGVAHTRSGIAMGTPSYMAPEQIRDARSVDRRADIWSLGCILYELCTRQRAFPGDEALAIYNAVVDGEFVHPRVLRPDLPDRVEQAILGCLSVDLDARIPDCETLLAVLAGTISWVQGTDDHVTTDFSSPRLAETAITVPVPSDAPTMSVARRELGGPTPAPAPSRSAGMTPLGLEEALLVPYGFDHGDEQETVITTQRALDGTLSPHDSFDHPARAGLLGFLGGGLLAFGLVGLGAATLLFVVLGLIGSLVISNGKITADLDDDDAGEAIEAGAPEAEQPSDPPARDAPAPAEVSPRRPRPQRPAPQSTSVQPAPDPTRDEPERIETAIDPPRSAPTEPTEHPPAHPAGQIEIALHSMPYGAVVTLLTADGPQVLGKAPQRVSVAPGRHLVSMRSGDQIGEFVVEVEAGGAVRWCFKFATNQSYVDSCPP